VSKPALVILGGSVTGLAVLRHAARKGFEPILVSEPQEVAAFSRFGIKLVSHPDDDSQTLRKLRQLSLSAGSGLIATSDAWLDFIRRNDHALREQFGNVLHPGSDALDICLDKLRFSAWCSEQNIPTPAGYEVAEAEQLEVSAYPLMVRPLKNWQDEKAADKAMEIQTPDQLQARLSDLRRLGGDVVITQSLLNRELEQVSIGFARRGASVVSMVLAKRRPTAGACACGSFVERVSEPRVQELGERVAVALDFYGIGEVEILRDRDSGECFVIEVNARPWLQFGLVSTVATDWLTFLLRPDAYKKEEDTGQSGGWLSFSDDFYHCFSRSIGDVTHGRIGVWAYLVSFLRVRAFSVWAADDVRPMLCMLRRSLGWSSK